jgi:ABC-2 type transport system permease protein
VIAFIVAAAVSFLFLMSGLDLVLDAFRGWAPAYVVDLVGSLSFLTHFAAIAKGVISLPTVVFLVSFMLLCLFINTQVIEIAKAA